MAGTGSARDLASPDPRCSPATSTSTVGRGAFFDLVSIPTGAEIIVTGDLSAQRYVVTAREQIAKAEVDLARYFTNDGPERITLITCGGAFDRGVGHYRDNIIVTAVPDPAPS